METKYTEKDYQPYDEETCVSKRTSDDLGSISMILGIIAIVCVITGFFSIIGFVLGIIALVKGAPVRKQSGTALAGWVLGIISIALFALYIILFFAFFFPILIFPFYLF